MNILYIYRHPDMGYSIGRVFRPIQEEMKKYAMVDAIYMPCNNYKPWGLWKNIQTARKICRAKHYDIVHITGAEHYLIPFLKRRNKVIITVHDMGTDKRTYNLRSIWRYLFWYRTLSFADKITFISESTKREALKYLHLKKGQTVVVPNPIGNNFTHIINNTNNMNCPMILHIGTAWRKNLQGTIEALAGINCRLRIIGQLNKKHLDLLYKNKINYTNDTGLSDEQIIKEYANCDIVSFPTFYEGFGMPIIESQMIGRPVVTSNLSPMKEVAGEGAVLINPYDINSIREGYLHAMSNYDTIVKKGRYNVRLFSLEHIASKYFSIYQNVL